MFQPPMEPAGGVKIVHQKGLEKEKKLCSKIKIYNII